MSDNDKNLVLKWEPVGQNGTATVTARLGDDVLHVEKLDLLKPKARAGYAEAVCKGRPGLDQEAIENELMGLAAEVADKPSDNTSEMAGLAELDTSRIVRPERFITTEVSGLAVPTMANFGDKVVGRWHLYLRWQDGAREKRPLESTLGLPSGGRLFIHPESSEPTPMMKPGWSVEARQRWLDSSVAPNAADLFKRLCKRVAYFIDLPTSEAPGITATLACWVIHTYCYRAWPATPYLYVGGPLGSGKSRLFEILIQVVFIPLASSSLTAAALFRTLHGNGGTLLLDEAERLRSTKDTDVGELLSMLLAGYKRGGSAIRLEPVGESGFRTVSFDVFTPKALACIAGLPPALASRCIPITMFRAAPGSEKPRRRIDADPAGWQLLRDDLHALALEHGPTFVELAERVDVCPEMSGRDFELWQPLLAIASWIEESGAEGLLQLMQEHALDTIDAGRDDQAPDHDETLLRLLTEAIRRGERPTSGELLEKAKETEPEGFKRWSPRGVAGHLKRYGLTTNKTDGRKRYGRVMLDDLGRIQTNYGIDLDFK